MNQTSKKMNKKLRAVSPSLVASVLWLAASLPTAGWAQAAKPAAGAAAEPVMDHSQMNMGDMKGMDHGAMKKGGMKGMDHSRMNMGGMKGMDHSTMKKGSGKEKDHSQMNMGGMKGMDHGAMNKGGMNGMDHGAMDKGSMPDMDHSQMNMGEMNGMDHGAMDKGSMPGMDHSQMNMGEMKGMDHGAMDKGDMKGMDHSQMNMGEMKGMDHGAMDMGAMQGGNAPPDARDPDAYSNGLTHGPMKGMDMNDNGVHAQLLVDRLEATHTHDDNSQTLDAQAWFGTDLNKLWINLEAERSGGRLESARTEVLWDHALTAYWNLQTGVRHDSGGGPGRTWAALGIRGLAPYWFELQATAYVGESGRTAARVEAEYDLLLTQRLILQPRLEVNAYGKSDPARGLGSGLSDLEAGVRLRYEITRKFAPYVGVSWGHKFGGTADYARRTGEDASEAKWVAGVKFWF